MAILTPEFVWRDFIVDGSPMSGIHDVDKSQVIAFLDQLITASDDASIFISTLGELQQITDRDNYTGAYVLDDAIGTNNGIYKFDELSSIWRKLRDLPDTIAVVESVSGTANNIIGNLKRGINPSAAASFILVPGFTNTSTTVSSTFDGIVRPIKRADGGDIGIGDLQAGFAALLFVDGNQLRQEFPSNVAQVAIAANDGAVIAAADAEQAKVEAEAARDAAQGAAETVVVGRYNSQSGLGSATVSAVVKSAQVTGFADAGDGGEALFKRVALEPTHAGKVRSQDRFLPDGTTDPANGGWWEISSNNPNPIMFGAVGDSIIDDTLAFTRLETKYSDISIDLIGREYFLSSFPIVNRYYNGSIRTSNFIFADLDLTSNPKNFGAVGDGVTNDKVSFTRLENIFTGKDVDLNNKSYYLGESQDINVIPNENPYINGFWKLTGFDPSLSGNPTVEYPANNTLFRYQCILDGGRRVLGWPQGTMHSYDGNVYVGYMASNGHNPGQMNWSLATSKNKCLNYGRIEYNINFGEPGEAECFSAVISPISGSMSGPSQVALVKTGNLMYHFTRDIALYNNSAPGGVQQVESDWVQRTTESESLGSAIRTEINNRYNVTTTGLPTLLHSASIVGSILSSDGNVLFGFHGLEGSIGPVACFLANGAAGDSPNIMCRKIGLLTEGVEPSIFWFEQSSGSRLGGFIRSQGTDYPIRFWSTTSSSFDSVETATIQDCPYGNEFGLMSPILCAMRPNRKGTTSGYIPTSETLDGIDSDELNFVFTGKRTRDGTPGPVGLYWGRVTKGPNSFDDFWNRARIIFMGDLNFSNSNVTSSSNQVGLSDITFSDSNTLHIATCTESSAISGDNDSSYIKTITVKLSDDYSDEFTSYSFDDGSNTSGNVQFAPEFVPFGKKGKIVNLGAQVSETINAGTIKLTGSIIALNPESGTTDQLDSITEGNDGDFVLLKIASSTNTVTIENGIGNITLAASNFILNNARDRLELSYDSGSDEWVEISRSDNANG